MDASWAASSGHRFVGIVARDSARHFLAARRQRIVASSADHAEALALLHGSKLGISQGYRYIILESDSMESISCLNGNLEHGS